jgi:hypothetical protein
MPSDRPAWASLRRVAPNRGKDAPAGRNRSRALELGPGSRTAAGGAYGCPHCDPGSTLFDYRRWPGQRPVMQCTCGVRLCNRCFHRNVRLPGHLTWSEFGRAVEARAPEGEHSWGYA